MNITPKERAREDYMKEYELTEEEMKQMEGTAYFQSRVLNYAIEDFRDGLLELVDKAEKELRRRLTNESK